MINKLDSLNQLLNHIQKGDLSVLTIDAIKSINDETVAILEKNQLEEEDVRIGNMIVLISNILYNNTNRAVLPLDDGVYDLLVVKIGSKVVGAPPTTQVFDDSYNARDEEQLITPVVFINKDKVDDFLFYDNIKYVPPYPWTNVVRMSREPTARRALDTNHNYPELVGTLDKCKFVMNHEARERGVFNDDSVSIFERDFIQKHLEQGIIDPNDRLCVVAELKYDGVSIEADVTNMVHGARSRGDTANDLATDLTPILGGYTFPYAPGRMSLEEMFGMKFEAILTRSALVELSRRRNKPYANCRNAMQAILGSLDGYRDRDLITLVPLATSLGIDRLSELEFMNKYYNSGEPLRYAVLTGNYIEILFQVKRFVEEAQYLREYLPFMYDGVVISYVDEHIKAKLGRKNSVNKYSIAIKFNPLVKQATFLGYGFTVGQAGNITPMIHYTPVEFYGTIHSKSTGHSFQRFNELALRPGDILNIEYTNDVMPYVTKANVAANDNNTNPPVKFISNCPGCGSKLIVSQSGRSIHCPNIACPERNVARIANMFAKLNLKDFSEKSVVALGKTTLHELFSIPMRELVDILGEVTAQKFVDRLNVLRTEPIEDYKLIGALGFTGLAQEKFRIIMEVYNLKQILSMDDPTLYEALIAIKGIGPQAARTIVDERTFFMGDLVMILSMPNIIITQGRVLGKSIRFSGVRDELLEEQLCKLGYDASSSKGVTKATDILLVPSKGYTSSKTSKAGPTTLIIPIMEFKENIDSFL